MNLTLALFVSFDFFLILLTQLIQVHTEVLIRALIKEINYKYIMKIVNGLFKCLTHEKNTGTVNGRESHFFL